MIGYAMVETTDLAKAILFYDAILQPLDLIRVEENFDYVAHAARTALDVIEFYVTRAFDQQLLRYGNVVIIAFAALRWAIVDQFHEIGVCSGGGHKGEPGPQPSGRPAYHAYHAYLGDPNGNKISGFNDCNTA